MGSLINAAELKVKAIAAITKNKLIFIEDVCAMCGISKPTFYDRFKVGTDDFNDISNLLEQNKIDIKVAIRQKWYKGDNPTGHMALYKLCSTPEEHKKLQQNYIEQSGETTQTIVWNEQKTYEAEPKANDRT